MELIKLKIHSIVSEITNSSTVIYTYQDGSVGPAKELINEMLKLSGVLDKKAEDIFYFGVFVEDEDYFTFLENYDEAPEDYPKLTVNWNDPERKGQEKLRDKWLSDLQMKIMKGEIVQPDWMDKASESGDGWSGNEWAPSSYLHIIAKEKKYEVFGNKIRSLLNSVDADGGRDG